MTTSTIPPLPIAPGKAPHPVVERLNEKLQRDLERALDTELFRRLAAPETSPELATALMRHIMAEIFAYGRHVIEATFTAIGRMPHTHPELMKGMAGHIMDEVTHPDMALEDFKKLGGDEQWARNRRMSPPALAMAAVCRHLGERESPFCYLGFMYLFEALTSPLSQRAMELLEAKGVPVEAQKFIEEHIEGDIKHTKWLAGIMAKCIELFPEADEAIEYGYDCFASVYPAPIWDAVVVRALAETSS